MTTLKTSGCNDCFISAIAMTEPSRLRSLVFDSFNSGELVEFFAGEIDKSRHNILRKNIRIRRCAAGRYGFDFSGATLSAIGGIT